MGVTGATVVRPDRGHLILSSIAAVALALAGVAASVTSLAGQMPHVWLFSAIAFTWLTLDWGNGLLPRPSRALLVNAAAIWAITLATALSTDAGLVDSLRSATGVVVQASVLALVYQGVRQWFGSPPCPHLEGVGQWRNGWAAGWTPTTPLDLGGLIAGAAVSGPVGLLIGSAPGLNLDTASDVMALQWLSQVLVVASVGGATILITFATWAPADLDQPWGQVLVVWLASVGVLWWVYATGAVNMAWLAVMPAIFIAMSYRIWVTSTFGLLIGLISILLSPALNTFDVPGGPIPLGSVMDLLVSTLILVTLVVAQLNQRRDQLLADLATGRTLAARQAEILRNIFETMQDGVVVVDRHLTIQMHNSAAEQLLGRVFPSRRPPSWTEYFGMTRIDGTPLPEGELIRSEFLTIGVAGGTRLLRQTVSRLTGESDDGWLVFVSDITDHQTRLQELSGFAGIVAHDLRSPLTSLEGWLELAQEAINNRETQDAGALLARARGSNRRMREVITDWLDYTVEREGNLDMETFPLAAPLRAVTNQIAETGPHHFTFDTPHEVRADLGMVRQLFANLGGNASKFTRPSTPPVITVRSTPARRGWIRIDVSDEGIGLPAGEEDRIFEEYHRGGGRAGRQEGYGLGLSACRRIVERHGGEISAHTNERGGATISFTLPSGHPAEGQR